MAMYLTDSFPNRS